jgi:hypothetical protein
MPYALPVLLILVHSIAGGPQGTLPFGPGSRAAAHCGTGEPAGAEIKGD